MGPSDTDLLRDYAQGSEAAFAALVGRHVNLVYSAARRQVRSPELAEEVAQSVFCDLARQAARFPRGTALNGWLYLVTRRTAIDTMRQETRRHSREQAAGEISAMNATPDTWTRVEPLLDEAMETLPEADRGVLLLRFFEEKSLREVGETLGTSEDAAQKRVARAVEQLRALLFRRGVAVTAAGLATDLSAHAIQIAPSALGSAITSGLAAISPAVATSATVITMTLLEKTFLAAGLVVALGGALIEANSLRAQRRELAAVRQQTELLAAQARDAEAQRDLALRQVAELRQRLATLAAGPPLSADPALDAALVAWLDRAARLRQLAIDRPELAIPEFVVLTSEQWMLVAKDIDVSSEFGILNALGSLRRTAEEEFSHKLVGALRAYLTAHDDIYPDDSSLLAPYFTPPVPPATLARYKMVARGSAKDDPNRTVFEQQSVIDPDRDYTRSIGLTSMRSISAVEAIITEAFIAFTKAHNGKRPTTVADLTPFLPRPIDPYFLEKVNLRR